VFWEGDFVYSMAAGAGSMSGHVLIDTFVVWLSGGGVPTEKCVGGQILAEFLYLRNNRLQLGVHCAGDSVG
jgi:hypothetical protein